MPQGPFASNIAKTAAGVLTPLLVDANGYLLISSGISIQNSSLNLTAAAVIKASQGNVFQISVIDPGTTGGGFVLNDCKTTGAATLANEIWSLAYNATANKGGAIFTLNFPTQLGLVLSAVPTGGTPQLAISWL